MVEFIKTNHMDSIIVPAKLLNQTFVFSAESTFALVDRSVS
jgi:hypothetical protein